MAVITRGNGFTLGNLAAKGRQRDFKVFFIFERRPKMKNTPFS